MKVIGLTGGVGSGKSTVANMMKNEFQAQIIIADQVGHLMMQKGYPSYDLILHHFGEEILDEKKEIDRKKLSNLVFIDNQNAKEQLKILNSFIHPYVYEYINEELKKIKKSKEESIVVIETAILFEAGFDKICDEVWYINTTMQVRRNRLKQSRNYTDEKIDSIMANQLTEQDFMKYCTKIINNDGELEKIRKQIQLLLVN